VGLAGFSIEPLRPFFLLLNSAVLDAKLTEATLVVSQAPTSLQGGPDSLA